jgi:hypothetical protein
MKLGVINPKFSARQKNENARSRWALQTASVLADCEVGPPQKIRTCGAIEQRRPSQLPPADRTCRGKTS